MFGVSKIYLLLLFKKLILFSKDSLNRSKVTVKIFIMFQINAVLSNFLFINRFHFGAYFGFPPEFDIPSFKEVVDYDFTFFNFN